MVVVAITVVMARFQACGIPPPRYLRGLQVFAHVDSASMLRARFSCMPPPTTFVAQKSTFQPRKLGRPWRTTSALQKSTFQPSRVPSMLHLFYKSRLFSHGSCAPTRTIPVPEPLFESLSGAFSGSAEGGFASPLTACLAPPPLPPLAPSPPDRDPPLFSSKTRAKRTAGPRQATQKRTAGALRHARFLQRVHV